MNPSAAQHNISGPFATEPSESGALSGHAVRCSCGYVMTTSLSAREAMQLGAGHAAWAAAKTGKR